MKRKISICIIFLTFASCLSIFAVYDGKKSENKSENKSKTETETQVQEQEEPLCVTGNEWEQEGLFFLMEEEGHLVIKKADSSTETMETGILLQDLPRDLQESVREGISFSTTESLLEFLENYAS